jgi:PIN domain nuclease of toxin-antitoxin system
MKALLDTHSFLWAITEDSRLSHRARQIFTANSSLWLSVVSVWEILIKVRTGKLALPEPTGSYLVKELTKNQIDILPLSLDHVLRLEQMELHHRDPFDRILIAQSLEESLPIVTSDPQFEKYPIELIW